MSIIPGDFTDLHRTVDALFRDFSSGLPVGFRRASVFGLTGSPMIRTDVRDEGDHYKIWMDLPGLTKQDLKVCGSENELCVEVHKADIEREQMDKYVILQRPHGKAERRIQFPDEVDLDKVNACIQHGVLCLQVPKKGAKKDVKEILIEESEEGMKGSESRGSEEHERSK